MQNGPSHRRDEELGCTNDTVADRAVEEGEIARFEAQIPLDSSDEYDKPPFPGEMRPVIVARSDSDDYEPNRTYRGGASLQLDLGE